MAEVRIVVPFNHFPRIGSDLEGKVNDAVGRAVLSVVARADAVTPVDTGALRANKTIEVGGGIGSVTWNQDYAAYVEMGTSRMAPQPFAQPSVDAVAPQFFAELAKLGFT